MDSNHNDTLMNTTDTNEHDTYRFLAEEVVPVPAPENEATSQPPTEHTVSSEETSDSTEAVQAADTVQVADATQSVNVPDTKEGIDTADTANVTETAQPAKPPKKKKEHRVLKKIFGCIGLAACFGIVAGGAFFGVRYAFSYFFPKETEQLEEFADSTDILLHRPNITIASTATGEVGETDATETVAAVVEQTMPAMVSIQTIRTTTSYFWGQPITNDQEGGGSGIIVGSNENDLLIATNYHVIENTSSVKAILADGTTHNVSVKGSDADADLAILALPLSGLTQDTLDNIDIAVLGDSDNSRIGQMVIAIGNALGYGPTVTVGYLSAKDREITIEGNDMVLLQTNAAINSGNSGGALLNTKGEVIGINNAKLTSTDIEGICFAIPISEATPILDDLMTREILSDDEKGYLGVTVTELGSDVFRNWPEGVYVSAVADNSAAQKSNIYPGDIITHVNGEKVTTTNQLVNAVTSHRYGTVVEITLQRIIDGKFEEFTFSVTLQQNPELSVATDTVPEEASVPEEAAPNGRRPR